MAEAMALKVIAWGPFSGIICLPNVIKICQTVEMLLEGQSLVI